MIYTSTILKTKADCDAVLSIATKEKDNLEFRKESLERQSSSAIETATEIQAELEALNAELAYLDTAIAGAPEGSKHKEDNIVKWRKADHRKFLLTARKNNYGVVTAMDKQYDIACVEKMIEETNNFISVIEAHKNEL